MVGKLLPAIPAHFHPEIPGLKKIVPLSANNVVAENRR